MPQSPNQVNKVIERTAADKISIACDLMKQLDGRKCTITYAVERGMDLLIKDLQRKLNKR